MMITRSIILSLLVAFVHCTPLFFNGDFNEIQKTICEYNKKLICNLTPTENSTVKGRVLFEPLYKDYNCQTSIRATVTGLSPMKKQAVHIHSYGDLSASTGKSLGGHFSAPGSMKYAHGFPGSKVRHWGDFGSLVANEEGIAEYSRIDSMIKIPGIVGRGMVVHAKEDLGPMSQPSGGAGPRMAMCVIGYANPEYID